MTYLICTSSPHYAPSLSNIDISLFLIECSGSIIRRIDMQIQVIIDLQWLLQDDTAPVQFHGCKVVPLLIECKDMAVKVILKARYLILKACYCSCLRMERVEPTSFPNCQAKVHWMIFWHLWVVNVLLRRPQPLNLCLESLAPARVRVSKIIVRQFSPQQVVRVFLKIGGLIHREVPMEITN